MRINFVLMFIGAQTSEEFSVVKVAVFDEMILVVFLCATEAINYINYEI